jgi:ribonuclease P protein component
MPPDRGALRFPREHRLRSRAEFQRVRSQGTPSRGRLLMLGLLIPGPAPHPRLGVVTTRKVGGAVVRARLRRLIREIFRVHQPLFLRAFDCVVVPHPPAAQATFAALREELLYLWRKAGLLPSA